MQYLINSGEPFKGYVQSVLTKDGTVAYTDGQTIPEYEAERGIKVEVISEDQLNALLEKHHDSLITKPKRITKARYWDMLECLPPCRWGTVGGFEVFHVSERLTHNLVSWFANQGDKYWEFTDRDNLSAADIANKLKAA